jgi:hypothetical protein
MQVSDIEGGKAPQQGDVNIISKTATQAGRGSPSLVGRGIANPMSERTRGFEIPRKDRTKFPLPAPCLHVV